MSSTVRQYGFVAVLLKPLTEVQREVMDEKLYDEKSDLGVVYNGELLYINFNQHKSLNEKENFYGLFLGSMDKDHRPFIAEAAGRGLYLDLTTIRPYNCIYYNGSDSPLDMLTKEKLLAGDVSDL